MNTIGNLFHSEWGSNPGTPRKPQTGNSKEVLTVCQNLLQTYHTVGVVLFHRIMELHH